jgi:RNA polymerase sigma factor (sigma-70 family)
MRVGDRKRIWCDRCGFGTVDCDIYIDHMLKDHNTVLDLRETKILRMRYREGKTLQEIGRHFNITRERVRQIEKSAKQKVFDRL